MRQKIENHLHITVEGADLTGATKAELYLRQGMGRFYQYTPEILSESEILVTIPFEDAAQLSPTTAMLQLAWVDADGNRIATDPEVVSVGVLLKEAGYDPS